MLIYKTTNKINGKIYVGKTTGKRKDDCYYFGSGLYLRRAIKKYGTENFVRETLEECTEDNVNEREIHWINTLNARNPEKGYNFATGGEGGLIVPRDYLSKMIKEKQWGTGSEVRRKKQREKVIGDKNPAAKTMKVTYPDGTIEIVKGIRVWCKKYNVTYNTVLRWARQNKIIGTRTNKKDTSLFQVERHFTIKKLLGFKFEML